MTVKKVLGSEEYQIIKTTKESIPRYTVKQRKMSTEQNTQEHKMQFKCPGYDFKLHPVFGFFTWKNPLTPGRASGL
jgi:hypothetical protein